MSKPVSQAASAKITQCVTTLVSSWFAMFHNPKIAGPNFKWKNFEDLMEKRASVDVVTQTMLSKPEHIELATKLAREEARRLLKLMTE